MVNKMECPCEKCLVRPACRSRVVRKNIAQFKTVTKGECLIVEYLQECPMIADYFGKVNGKFIHTYKKIDKVCKCMKVPDSYFVWYANEIGIYKTI